MTAKTKARSYGVPMTVAVLTPFDAMHSSGGSRISKTECTSQKVEEPAYYSAKNCTKMKEI